eukprot:TRINITY_DN13907_c0_g1_i2.p1 TRINITY_DN13907_c0_g1~~TRINITY_DN13907_c0_g1_i2.p1  ORF type:complete len:305 (+),score=36.67 TRINITY_DN13907_c0_g1_i2:68-982(+)
MANVLLLLILLIFLYITYKLMHKPRRPDAPPMPSGALPFLGHIVTMVKDPVAFYARAREQCGHLCTIRIFTNEVILLLTRDHLKEFFTASEEKMSFDTWLEQIHVREYVFGSNDRELADCNLQVIRKANQAKYDDTLAKIVHEAIDTLPSSGELDLFVWSRRLVAHMTIRAIMNVDMPEGIEDALLEYEAAMNTATSIGIMKIPTWIMKLFVMPKVEKLRRNFCELMRPIVAQIKNPSHVPTVYTSTLLAYRRANGDELNDDELCILVSTLLVVAVSNSTMGVAEAILYAVENKHMMFVISYIS